MSPFPHEGKVRAKQAAPFLGIGKSTFWAYVKEGRICQPMRYGPRVSVWSAEYIRQLAETGIPDKGGVQ
ncbi:MAG: transcriptional regulator [Thiothrix nivea]|nr:MAG: transcriptional regulator [Thiothrix nivea]